MLRPLPTPPRPRIVVRAAAARDGSSSRTRVPAGAGDAQPPGVDDPSGIAPPTHWIGALGDAHYVVRIERDGLAYGGGAACGTAIRGGRPIFRGEAHPRCGACIGRLIDGIGSIPD